MSLIRRSSPLTPSLLPQWLAIVLGVVLALAATVGLFALLLSLLNLAQLPPSNPAAVGHVIEVTKASLGVAAGAGAVVALVVAMRRSRLGEAEGHRDLARLFTERFSTAAEQLGHEKAAVRLAGLYALARLADDWREQQQMCWRAPC